jgi:hypothetical protein
VTIQLPSDTQPLSPTAFPGDATGRTLVLLDLTERLIAANPHVPAGEVLAAVQRHATEVRVDLVALESSVLAELGHRPC